MPSGGASDIVSAGLICKNVVYDPSFSPRKVTVFTNLNTLSGKCANTTFDPGTGCRLSLRVATNEPGWNISEYPSPVSTSPLPVTYWVPRLTKLGLANTPLFFLTVVGASYVLLGSVNVIVGTVSYPDPGSMMLTWNSLSCATLARPVAVAPVLI